MMQPLTNVLLIEDDEQDYVIARELLAQASGERFSLRWADRLSAGLAEIAAGGLDVILLDVSLPDSQGWSTFEQVRSRAKGLPIILLTGRTDEELGFRAMKDGAQDYLCKGRVDSAVLTRAIRYAIERQQAKTSLKRYQEHLEELVSERTIAFTTANDQLQHEVRVRSEKEAQLEHALQRLREHARAQTDFVSNVSHELKTPLASLTFAIENMAKGVLGPVPERMQPYLSMMKDDCARLASTISDILDLSRLDAKRLALDLARMPFETFVRCATVSLRLQAEKKKLQFRLDMEKGIRFVLCDPHRMERIIFNLVHNSIKFTEEGGWVAVGVKPDAADGRFVLLSVTDSGIGISAAHLPHIAERYFRVGEHVSGAGLGLSLCKDLVTLHNGTMIVESPAPGQERGTAVTVRLPGTRAPAILLMEPDEKALTCLRGQLTEYGCGVTSCVTGEEARAALDAAPPDIALLGSASAAATTIEIIAHIRSKPNTRLLPVIAMTEDRLSTPQKDALRSLRVLTIAKPFDIGDLLTCMVRAIAENHCHREEVVVTQEGVI